MDRPSLDNINLKKTNSCEVVRNSKYHVVFAWCPSNVARSTCEACPTYRAEKKQNSTLTLEGGAATITNLGK